MKTIVKRRKENKTDYLNRLKLLKGGIPRVVFRKTNKYITAQYVNSKQAQDKVEMGVSSNNLLKYGWPKEFFGSLKSTPATYLTGLLMGKKIKDAKKITPLVDLGMLRTIHKSKVFAFIKGLVDAGVEIKYKEKTFPNEDRISGKHMKKDFSKQFEEIKLKILK